MKNLFYIALLMSAIAFGQTQYVTKTGILNFEASVPSFEEVAAKTNSVTAIIDTETGEIAALVFVKAFRFKNALMEEHFNENYAESNTFPKATFSGKILNFSIEKNSSGNFFIDGELTFHGTSKKYENIPVTVEHTETAIVLMGKFTVLASDFNLKIPKIVQNKVTDEVKVSFNFELEKK